MKRSFHRRRTHFARISIAMSGQYRTVDLTRRQVLTVDLLAAEPLSQRRSRMLNALDSSSGRSWRVVVPRRRALGDVADESADGVLCSSVLKCQRRTVLARFGACCGRVEGSSFRTAIGRRRSQPAESRAPSRVDRSRFLSVSICPDEVSPSHGQRAGRRGFHLTRSTKFDPFLLTSRYTFFDATACSRGGEGRRSMRQIYCRT
jgi:hypothetical protein